MKAVLFDLDGTLLPMDTHRFMRRYLQRLTEVMTRHGFDPQRFENAMFAAAGAVLVNDGSRLNRELFWQTFFAAAGGRRGDEERLFDAFYENEYRGCLCDWPPKPEQARRAVRLAREKAGLVVLATSPFFPLPAAAERLRWAGLHSGDFDYITTYDNASYNKTHPGYYKELLAALHVRPEDALMIGNDVAEDILPARRLGIGTFLVTDCLINKKNEAHDSPCGSFGELLCFLETL